MVMNVQNQLYSFFVMLYGGIIIAIIYDVYKVIRIIIKPKRIATDIGDITFWIIGTIVFIFFLYISNYVEIRFYTFLGFIIGALAYNVVLSPFVVKTLLFIYRILFKIVIKTFKMISYPIVILYKALLVPYRYLAKIFSILKMLIDNIVSHFNLFKKKK
ncbi:spore cortex biosynthesis protein YabQ [Thermoanaerobacterium sp. RBIITD]|uniref:spore cortex biosynthesis protein YabQ n=1 Tax=Thermoanaerobacterium sp. RBIITD TaxID=1550240 RepID=UPI000BB93B30|nr:spore cortex biosynthesis protein YabQ [Thermoanaerobacterium sp. RBIITD]SNX54035.1 spore cortex biosynthesis protein YabQ [Thermoanaerobacterium sp. RBIITD]